MKMKKKDLIKIIKEEINAVFSEETEAAPPKKEFKHPLLEFIDGVIDEELGSVVGEQEKREHKKGCVYFCFDEELDPEIDGIAAIADVAPEVLAWKKGIDDERKRSAPSDDLKEKKKEKVKNAVAGNPWRRPAGTEGAGQMTDKEHAGSFSLYFASKGKKGKGGRAQVKNGKELFTKATDCGRKDVDGKKKNTYKCSKPKEKYEE
mgnify:CR=1 FL=1